MGTSCLILGAFEPTLRILQGWSDVSSSALEPWLLNTHPSMKDNLVTIPTPAYARTGLRFDLTVVLPDLQSMSFAVGEDLDRARFYPSTILDVSPADALLHSLQHAVALIHEPSGTRGSFAVSGIVRILAKAKLSADLGPVVCVSDTKHALDQLLERLSGYKLRVMRVGSRSRSEILDAWNLKRLVHDKELSKTDLTEMVLLDRMIMQDLQSIGLLVQQLRGQSDSSSDTIDVDSIQDSIAARLLERDISASSRFFE